MRDGVIRRGVKAVVRTLYLTQLRVQRRRAQREGEARWALGGECRQCAACCERPSIEVDRITWYLPSLRRAFLWWQRVVNGFELVDLELPRVFVFRCTHFDPVKRRCDSYESRPGICRDYPRFLLSETWPEFLPGCGYRPVDQKGERLLVALGTAKLSNEQREELKQKLRLK